MILNEMSWLACCGISGLMLEGWRKIMMLWGRSEIQCGVVARVAVIP